MITQRLPKAALAGRGAPYAMAELGALAKHLNAQKDVAKRVERPIGRSAAAMLLLARIGEQPDAMVTGAADKGTWAQRRTWAKKALQTWYWNRDSLRMRTGLAT